MSRKTRIRLIEDIAIATGLLIGNTVNTQNFNSYQLLELILNNLEQLVANNGIPQTGNGTGNRNNQINVESITQDLALENISPKTQELTNATTTDLNVLLPTNPGEGLSFVIINHENSTANLICNSVVILPSDIYELIWNGAKWREV